MAKVLDERGALQSTVIVFTSSEDAAYMRVIAPMAGCAIGEYFRDTGNQVLIVYDDLTKHSWAHRQISLLLGLAPGREAYPGDIFYLHARLLERAANVNHSYIKKMSGISAESGSLTALPIIETQGGDLSSFIPTNVISITDGQIVLDAELFNLGIRPALDAGASVSRVGKAAQNKIIRQLSSDVRLFIAQYRELEGFTGLASELDSNTKEKLNRGQKTTLLLTQKAFESVTPPELAIYLLIIKDNLLGDINLEKLIECAKFIVNEIYINENVSFKRLEQDLILTEKENLFFKNLILSKKNIFVQKDNLQTHV
jgi:F-type H+-transporting ATPase subunit alpha